MQYFILSILAIPFLWINYKIIQNDLKEKKIPNKLLGYLILLLPFLYIYNIYYLDLNYLFFWISILMTFVISFILYYYWIWSAWDAKYLLVLALFIWQIWIITFVWNIALITIIYLILYFIWFYFWKCIFNFDYSKKLYFKIYLDLKDKTTIFLKHSDWLFHKKIIVLKILKWISLFLIIFVSLRLARLYIIENIITSPYYNVFKEIFLDYSTYFLILIVITVYWLFYLVRKLINKIKNILKNKSKIENNYTIDFILISILLIFLLSFIFYEYSLNPSEIKNYLLRIFTIYIWIYIIFRILKYAYKITFSIAETHYIYLSDLKEWDIIDRDYLIKMFWEQKSLWFVKIVNEEKDEKLLLYPNPAEYFRNIENPIDIETKEKLIEIFEIVNNHHKKENTNWYEEVKTIKILYTFAFAWYIFIWFILSFFLWDTIFKYLFENLLNIIKQA